MLPIFLIALPVERHVQSQTEATCTGKTFRPAKCLKKKFATRRLAFYPVIFILITTQLKSFRWNKIHSFHIILIPLKKKKLVPRKELLNPLHPNINMHILHTIIHTFLIILKRRICLEIKSFVYYFLYSHGFNEIEHYSLV